MDENLKLLPKWLTPKRIALAVTSVLFLGFAISNVYFVDEGFRYVVTNQGEFSRIQTPGLNYKLPFIESKYPFSVREQKKVVYDVATKTVDNQRVVSDLYVTYRIRESALKDIYVNYGPYFETQIIDPLISNTFKEVMGEVNTVTLADKRDDISERTLERVNILVDKYGADVFNTKIEDIEYSEQFNAKVEAFAEEKAQVERAVQTVRRKEQEAEAAIAQAEGEAKSKERLADADYYAKVKQAEAEARRTLLAGEAEAETIRLITEELRKAGDVLPAYYAAKAKLNWKGEVPERMYPGTVLPMINLDSAD